MPGSISVSPRASASSRARRAARSASSSGGQPNTTLRRASPLVAARVVVREQRRALRPRFTPPGLEQERHALVELAALLQEQAFVGDLLRQALAEAVLVARQQALPVEDAAAL